jgi:RNA polymerase sigma-70 factor (ECF subfamily)
MQECLFAALKALGSYRFDGDIRHYVTKIALRIAIGAKRTSVARWQQHDLLKAEPQSEVPAPVPADWSSDEIDLVRRMLDNLSRLQSEALLMRIVLGFSVEEIAATTGVSRNTVKTRLRLGKNALRKNLRKTPFWANWLSRKNS